jgi:hypothetical protein
MQLRMVFLGGTRRFFARFLGIKLVYMVCRFRQVHATSLQQVQIQLIENIQATKKQGLCDVCGNRKHHVLYLVRLNKLLTCWDFLPDPDRVYGGDSSLGGWFMCREPHLEQRAV